jgi:extracellular factor (EF) 3-hydroxypalmitic acid methyl ester biosynthesis protein
MSTQSQVAIATDEAAGQPTRLAPHLRGCHSAAVTAAVDFTGVLRDLDRRARRQQRTVPTEEERHALHEAFWNRLIPALSHADEQIPASDIAGVRRETQTVLNPWMLRSRLWARCWLKPHGFPGDYRMLEWMYDLEQDACARSDQPAAVNLLDGLFRSVHSVQAVWHRRAWFAQLIARYAQQGAAVRVLDIASGGSRYVRDVVQSLGPRAVVPTFFDQDPAALAFVRSWLPSDAQARFICAPVSRIREAVPLQPESEQAPFDVVISTGLFDYLPSDFAGELVEHMVLLTRPGGTVAICNFSPDDASRVVKDWVADWRLVYRTASNLEALFSASITPHLSRSPDGGLLYAHTVIDINGADSRGGGS